MRRTEDAVSPVIGTILMVAVVVILAAVIASYAFGFAGSVQKTRVVAVTIQNINGTHIAMTYQGGQDAQNLEILNMTVNGDSNMVGTIGTILPVGTSHTMTGTTGQDHVIVVAHFSDGGDQVIYDAFR